jgi:ABC-2 type transport system ATP-binding protein
VAQAALEIDRISKRYGGRTALSELSMRVDAGELFGLVGGTGAGKTTTIRIAAGVLPADSGLVTWQGRPIEEEPREQIGYLPGQRGLYPQLRLVEQLVYLGELHGLPVNTAHRNAEIWLDRFGLRAYRAHRIHTLTASERQLAALAIALIAEPEVLVLDEPFTDLDPLGVDVVRNVLRERAMGGAAVLFSSVGLDLVEDLCDRIGILHNGGLVAVGSAEELRADNPDTVVIDAPDAPSGWAENLPGSRIRSAAGSRIVLELDAHTDDQAILAAALSTGGVREFRRQRCSLAERFGELLGADHRLPHREGRPL